MFKFAENALENNHIYQKNAYLAKEETDKIAGSKGYNWKYFTADTSGKILTRLVSIRGIKH